MKVNSHKRYGYQPRYYDERKERLKAMIAQHEEDNKFEKDSAEYRAKIKQRMEVSWNLNTAHATQSRSANIRLIVILIALVAVTYFIFDYVDMFSADITSIDNQEPIR